MATDLRNPYDAPREQSDPVTKSFFERHKTLVLVGTTAIATVMVALLVGVVALVLAILLSSDLLPARISSDGGVEIELAP